MNASTLNIEDEVYLLFLCVTMVNVVATVCSFSPISHGNSADMCFDV